MGKHKNTNVIFNKIKEHIYLNLNLYIIVSIFFIIGIVGGVLFSNNLDENVQAPVNTYIVDFINSLKNGSEIDYSILLKQTIINHIVFAILIWFMGGTVIGLPIVYGLVVWKGFSLSYCISAIIMNLGIEKGIFISIFSLLLQNLISIPAIIALGVSGNKLYKSIIKDKRKENIKVAIIKHTLFSFGMLCVLILSAIVETYLSSGMTQIYINAIEI